MSSVNLGTQTGTSSAANRSIFHSPLVQQGISVCAAAVGYAAYEFFSNASPLLKGGVAATLYGGFAVSQYYRSDAAHEKISNKELTDSNKELTDLVKGGIQSTNELAKDLLQSKNLEPKRETTCRRLQKKLPKEDSTTAQIIQQREYIAKFTKETKEGALEVFKHLRTEKQDWVEDKRNLTEELRISTEDAQMLRDYQADLERSYNEQKDKLSLTERQLRKVEADFDTMKKELNEQLAQKNQEIAGLKHQIAVLKQDMALLTNENNRLTTRIEDLERRTLSDEQLQEFEEMRASFRKQKKSERND